MNDTPNFYLALGQLIREHREKRNLTRKQLAVAVNGSESHIKAIETMNRKPTLYVFVLIAEAFGLDPEKLLREVRQRQAYLNDKDRVEE